MASEKHSLTIMKKVLSYFYKHAFREKPSYIFMIISQVILKTTSPFINIIFPALIVNELVGKRDTATIVVYVVAIVLGNGICNIALEALKCSIENVEDHLGRYFDMILCRRTLGMDFEQTEDPEVCDQLEKADRGISFGGISDLTGIIVTLISAVLRFIGVTAIILSNSWELIVIILLSIGLSTLINSKINRVEIKYRNKFATLDRRFHYVFQELHDFRYGKDIRLYGASDMISAKGEHTAIEISQVGEKEAKEKNQFAQIGSLVDIIREVFIYLFLGSIALLGKITLGTFTMLITSVSTFTESLSAITSSSLEVSKKCYYLNEFIIFMDYQSPLIKNHKQVEGNVPYEFEFKNVSFKYPRSEQYVLKNLNLKITPGQHLSIVGLNGAGKTTFVKLLCRLYDVTEGEILLNGTNIIEFEYKEYLKLFSVVFQDFKLLSFTIRDNIVLDNMKQLKDSKIIEYCRLSGVMDRINTLEYGIKTNLYKMFDESGIEPSGGEAQKISISRALAKDSPIVILDEPTSALDPFAEYEIYNSFDQLVGNKTAVYISHRLSSCRFSDVIAVFDECKLREYGTHEELVNKKDGLYSEMFAAQAMYYVGS